MDQKADVSLDTMLGRTVTVFLPVTLYVLVSFRRFFGPVIHRSRAGL